ncbi:hypothetical protein [Sinorhizobium americanum]|uniref:hypothetical protein n=1 Tax=Sinorhizobium americanum TaxID=194963 RepID=UPI0007D9EB2F|nr:hypothetical protein [Sinorhizobium americanum]OAP44004.1 hypothetical protein ATC00_28160 [Sinorhizobium americanum]
MPFILVRAASKRTLFVVDETNSDACVVRSAGEPEKPVPVVTGTPAQRPEVEGVAVVPPSLPQGCRCRRRGAVVCRTADGRLKGRPNAVFPSLAAIGRERPAGVIGKVCDRTVNVGKFGGRFFSGASIKVPTGGPKIAITHAARAILR